jgi:serine/threonine protein phosphatase PrpC
MAGCTAVVAYITNSMLYVANAGDSRCVLGRRGCAVDMSYDHKPDNPDELARITRANGSVIDGRVNGNLNLSRCLGDFEYKQNPELPPEKQMISANPDLKKI